MAPGQETSLAPSCLNLAPFGSKYTILKKKLGPFRRPPVIRGIVPTLPPRYTPSVTLRGKVGSRESRRALNVEPLV